MTVVNDNPCYSQLEEVALNMLPSTPKELDKLCRTEKLAAGSEIRDFVELMASAYLLDGPDRRSERRIRITLPVIVERLDERGQPLEFPVHAVTRDLSARGIGLVCQDPVGTQFVAIELPTPDGESIRVVARVLRCEPLGYYYDVGCLFVDAQNGLA